MPLLVNVIARIYCVKQLSPRMLLLVSVPKAVNTVCKIMLFNSHLSINP